MVVWLILPSCNSCYLETRSFLNEPDRQNGSLDLACSTSKEFASSPYRASPSFQLHAALVCVTTARRAVTVHASRWKALRAYQHSSWSCLLLHLLVVLLQPATCLETCDSKDSMARRARYWGLSGISESIAYWSPWLPCCAIAFL